MIDYLLYRREIESEIKNPLTSLRTDSSKKTPYLMIDTHSPPRNNQETTDLPFASPCNGNPIPIKIHGAKRSIPVVPKYIEFVPVGCSISEPAKKSKKREHLDLVNQVEAITEEKTFTREYSTETPEGVASVLVCVTCCDESLVHKLPTISIRVEGAGASDFIVSHFSVSSKCRIGKMTDPSKKSSISGYLILDTLDIPVEMEKEKCFSFKPIKSKQWKNTVSSALYTIMPVAFSVTNGREVIEKHLFVSFTAWIGYQFSSARNVNFVDSLDVTTTPSETNVTQRNTVHTDEESILSTATVLGVPVQNGTINKENMHTSIHLSSAKNITPKYGFVSWKMPLTLPSPEKPQKKKRSSIQPPEQTNQINMTTVSALDRPLAVPLDTRQIPHCIGSFVFSEMVRDDSRFKRVLLQYGHCFSPQNERNLWQVTIRDKMRSVPCIINAISIQLHQDSTSVGIEILYPGVNIVPSEIIVTYLSQRQNQNTILLGLY